MSIEPVAAADLSDGIERNYCSAQRAASRLARARRPRGASVPTSGVERQSYYPPADCGGAPSGPPRTLRSYKIGVTPGGAFLVKSSITEGQSALCLRT
jgi:hypothetical protein